MNIRPLIITGAILICLVSYYVCFEMHPYTEALQEEYRDQRLLVFSKDDIVGMTVTTQSGSPLVLEKKESVWQIIEPMHSPADQTEVDHLLSEISNLRIHRTLKEAGGPAQYGLDKPSLNITLQAAKEKYILSIGDKAPASDFYYARTSARNGIVLLPAGVRQYLSGQNLFALRDKHLVPVRFTKADRVRITRHSMIVEFVKDREGLWRFSSDNTKRLKTSRMDEFIGEVCSIEALGYDENLDLSRGPDIIIELSSRGNSQEVEIWVQGDKAFSDSGVLKGLVEIDSSFIPRIPVDPMEMLDRTIVSLECKDVTGIDLFGHEKKSYRKDRDGWYAGTSKIKDSDSVNQFIKSLGRLEYQDEYLILPRDAVREQVVRITRTGSSTPFDITVYSKYYVTVGKRIFRVNEGGVKILAESIQSFQREDM